MSTQTDPPCSAEDEAAIIDAAMRKRRHLRGLSRWLASPRWEHMSQVDQDLIRAEVRLVLEQITEGCK
jgi:hypothetical protein